MFNSKGVEIEKPPVGGVNKKFWTCRMRVEVIMLMFLVRSWKNAPIDPVTKTRKGKLMMNINLN